MRGLFLTKTDVKVSREGFRKKKRPKFTLWSILRREDLQNHRNSSLGKRKLQMLAGVPNTLEKLGGRV